MTHATAPPAGGEFARLMEVTSTRGWIALGVVGIALIALIGWSIVGSIPERIEGQGIVVRGGGLRQLRASGGGTLTKLAIKIGDVVKDGDVVGEISQVGTSQEIKGSQQSYDQAKREYEISKAEDEATMASIRSTIAGADADKRSTQLLRQKAVEDVTRLNDALAKGLVTKVRVEQAERDVANFDAQLNAKDAQIASQNAQIRNLQQKIRGKEDAVSRAQRDMEKVGAVNSSLAQIQSTIEGHVVELKRRVGDLVQDGDIVAMIEPPGAGIEPVVYVSSSNGKRIKPGMEAQVSPSTVRADEFGYMRGRIRVVGEYPVTSEAVKAVTGNDQLVQELLASGTKIEVHASLEPKPDAPSGYGWSSSGGPPFQIEGGTRVTVAVVVSRKRPISYVLPIFKSTDG